MNIDSTAMPSNLPAANSKLSRLVTAPMGRWHVTGKGVLGVLVASFIAAPFLEQTEIGVFLESAMISFVLAIGVLAVGGTRRTLMLALGLALPAMVAKWLNHAYPVAVPPEVHLCFAAVTVGYIAWQFLRFIMHARRVDSHVLCTGIAAFLLLALLWAFVYQLIDRQIPGSFAFTVGSSPAREMKGMISVYFSLVTLCTVGFGDIVPASDVARMCAMLEGATGVFFVAVMISRLMSIYTMERQDAPAGPGPSVPAAPAETTKSHPER